MKNILTAFLMGLTILAVSPSKAQIKVNVNIAAQPLWGPTGYNHVDYYYIPDIETYYNVPRHQFVYLENGKWNFSNTVPARYNGYNLYNGYKVVMNTPRPYLSFTDHRVKYAKYKGVKSKQASIKYSNDPKYYVVKGHPSHPHGGAPGQAKKQYSSTKKSGNSEHNSGKENKGKKH